jgi:crossover junction endodeoxyribonuclease RusA
VSRPGNAVSNAVSNARSQTQTQPHTQSVTAKSGQVDRPLTSTVQVSKVTTVSSARENFVSAAMSGSVFVVGKPEPQGSARAFVVNGRANVTHDNRQVKPWRQVIAAAVRAQVGSVVPFPDGPVRLEIEFFMPRRQREPRVDEGHTRRPDLDKCVRAVLDALTGVLYRDDAQVTAIRATKETTGAGSEPGVAIWWTQEEV